MHKVKLCADEVDARNLLGDGCLNLKAWVALHKVVRGRVCIQEKLHCGQSTQALVHQGLAKSHGIKMHGRPQVSRQEGRGRYLDNLLEVALDRAVAIAQVRNTASGIDEELNLNVARTRHEPLEEQSPVAERARCLRSTSLKGFVALFNVLDVPNSLTPAATDGFQDSACT
jgi:hypothetical protein